MKKINIGCFSGGGSKGAYQVGAIRALTDSGIVLDGLVGVSTGSIQAGILSLAEAGSLESQKKYLDLLRGIWLGLKKDKDIYTKPPFGDVGIVWHVLTKKSSIYTFKPFIKIMEKHIPDTADVPRPVSLGVVHLGSGEYEALSPKTGKQLKTAILASSSIPLFFPPVQSDMVDGGVRNITPLGSAFELARDILDQRNLKPEECEVNIFLALAQPKHTEKMTGKNWLKTTLLDAGKRAIGLLENENYLWDIDYALRVNDEVGFFAEHPDYEKSPMVKNKLVGLVYLAEPEKEPYTALEFDHRKIAEYEKVGFNDMLRVINGF